MTLDLHAEVVVARRRKLLELAQVQPSLSNEALAARTGHKVTAIAALLSDLRRQGHRIPYRRYQRRPSKT